MALVYTTDELVESVRSRGSIPDNAALGTTDASIIRHLNEEMYSFLLPLVMQTKEAYYMVTDEVALTSTSVRIPSRAIGQKLRSVAIVDSGTRSELRRIERDDLKYFNAPSTGAPIAYYLEGNFIKLVSDAVSGTLEISYFNRPGQLVLLSAARRITAVDLVTKIVTFATAIPTTWSTNDTFDIHAPMSGAELKGWDLSAIQVVGNNIEFTTSIDGSVAGRLAAAVGDYVCLANECVIPGLPKELHPILAQAALVRVKEALGDQAGVQLHKQTLSEMLKAGNVLITQRSEQQPRRLIGRGSLWFGGQARPTGDW